jgi:hypothetical protein
MQGGEGGYSGAGATAYSTAGELRVAVARPPPQEIERKENANGMIEVNEDESEVQQTHARRAGCRM